MDDRSTFSQIVIKNEMYVDWKTTPVTHTDHERVKLRFKGYEKLVLKEIENAKGEYFNRVFTAYKGDMKKTWPLLMKRQVEIIKRLICLRNLSMWDVS